MTNADKTKKNVSADEFYKMWATEADMTQTDIEKAAKALAPALAKALNATGLQKIPVSEAFIVEERRRSGTVPAVDKNGKPTGKSKKYTNVPTVSVRMGSNVLDAIKKKAATSTSTKKFLDDYADDPDTLDAIMSGDVPVIDDGSDEEYEEN